MYTFHANPLMLVAPLNTVYPAVFIILLLFFASVFVLIELLFQFTKHCIKLPQPLRWYSGSFLYSQCIYFLFLRLIFLGLVLLANCKHGISVQVELDLKVSLLSKFFQIFFSSSHAETTGAAVKSSTEQEFSPHTWHASSQTSGVTTL